MTAVGIRLARFEGLRQIGIVLAAVGAYELARVASEPNWAMATENARKVIRLEHVLLLGWERPLQQWFVNDLPDLVRAMNAFYFIGHFLLTAIFFLWLYHRSRAGFRVFRDGFLVATTISMLVHWLFPTAPPRLADATMIDTLRVFSGIDIGSPSTSALSNPVAAVPSLHAGYAVGVGVGIWLYTRSRWARGLAVVYPAAVVLTIIVTGNHFVFDAIAGMVVMWLGFALARRVRAGFGGLGTGGGGAILAAASRGGAVR